MPLVARPRISEAIKRSANRGVALVIAPAGYGKTEAIAETFGDIGRFVDASGVVDAASCARAIVSAVVPDALRALSQYLRRAADEADADGALVAWLARRLRGVDAPIVIDDFQRFAEIDAVRAFVTRLIDATIPSVRWVLASRVAPDLPIGSWISAQRMTLAVNADDLEFTFAEARALADAMAVRIEDANLAQILDDADGWPLVVRLILDAWERAPALPPVRIRTRGPLFAFFASEIWDRLERPDHVLLLAAAFAPNATLEVFEAAGFAGAAHALEMLVRRFPLLRRAPDGAYRVHDLFADFIRDRFADERGLRRDLLVALTRAYGRLEAPAIALQIALRGAAHDLVIEQLGITGAALIDDGFGASVSTALASLPARAEAHPIVIVMRGLLSAVEGNLSAADKTLRSVALGDLPEHLARLVGLRRGQLASTLGEITTAIADFEPLIEDRDVRTAAEAMVRMAAGLSRLARGEAAREILERVVPLLDAVPVEGRAVLYERIAITCYFLSDYAAGERHALLAVEFALQCDDGVTLRSAYNTLLSLSQVLYADTRVTMDYAERWLAAARESDDKVDLVKALVSNIILAAERGDVDTYDALYAEFHRLRRPMPKEWHVQLRWSDVLVEVGRGRANRAAQHLSHVDKAVFSKTEADFLRSLEGMLWALCGDEARAAALVNQSPLAVATIEYDSQQVVFGAAYRALTQWILGKHRKAQSVLPAIPAFLPESDVAILAAIRSICHCAPATMTQRKLELFIGPLTAIGLEGHAQFLRAVFTPSEAVALTRAELDILREVRAGGSSEEIALRLGRSPRTVESHIDSACRKLGCSGRTEALLYVIDQGWL